MVTAFKGVIMNQVVESEGRFFHPEQHPAPYGWARVSGERVEVFGQAGLWCEITRDQKPFTFRIDGEDVTVLSGFRNPDFNNGKVSLSLALLVEGDLDKIKTAMKVLGLPSCCRLNLYVDFFNQEYGGR
jgi:hypothetical protein